jgi:hypothetical protein
MSGAHAGLCGAACMQWLELAPGLCPPGWRDEMRGDDPSPDADASGREEAPPPPIGPLRVLIDAIATSDRASMARSRLSPVRIGAGATGQPGAAQVAGHACPQQRRADGGGRTTSPSTRLGAAAAPPRRAGRRPRQEGRVSQASPRGSVSKLSQYRRGRRWL